MSATTSTGIFKKIVPLWSAWWDIVIQLRPAFSRSSTFLWFIASLAAVCVRPDLRGVTSFVRALGLQRRCYERFLDFFHSSAVKLPALRASWTAIVLTLLKSFLFIVNGRIGQGDPPIAQTSPTSHYGSALQCRCLYARSARGDGRTGPTQKIR